jgi:hypothetical protein
MTPPDDATLRRMACGDGSVSDDATYAAWCAAEVLRLRAILTPRTTPPTPAEMAAHGAAGGVWLTAWPWRTGVWADAVVPALRARDAMEPGMTWLALDAARRPCAWPVVATPDAPRYTTTSRPGAAIEVEEHRLDADELAALDFGSNPFAPRGDR